MIPLTIEQQIERQTQKGCKSSTAVIEKFLKTSSYYTLNYSYEQYLIHAGSIKAFKIKDYEWLQKTNETVSKESLSIILRVERIVRNRIADMYSLYCKDNSLKYFSVDSLTVDSADFPKARTNEDKDSIKTIFILECWTLYNKKKKTLHTKYHFDDINDVPPFVIAQHLSFGHLRKFFLLQRKSIKETISSEFNMKISEFNQLFEKLNYLRNACAHGDFILDFKTQKGIRFSNNKFHKYTYCKHFILDENTIALLPTLAQCSYILQDDLSFFLSVIRNILEITNYQQKGSINKDYLKKKIGIKSHNKVVQEIFK